MRFHAVALLLAVASVAQAQATHAVRGTVTDPATRTPLSGALVEIHNTSSGSSARSDENGEFRFELPSGVYELVVRRIGYTPVTKQLTVSDRMVETTVEMHATAQKLAAVRVGEHGSGIYGVVESALLSRPMPYAKVQVVGAKLETVTDSVGSFFFDVAPGRYMVRIGRNGYTSEFFPVDVAKDQVVDASTILEKADEPEPKGMEGLWADFDQRLRWANMTGALLTGAELRHANANLLDAIMGSAAFIHQGLRLGNELCVFINGVPTPELPLEAYSLDNIQSIEVYGSGGPGDPGNFMSQGWPGNAPCSQVERKLPQALRNGRATVKWVGIWTRK